VTTHVVRLKLFRLKAEGIQKARSTHFGGNRADSRTKHNFKTSRIPVFPNPAYICVKWHIALYIVCNDIWYKSDCVIWCFSLCHM